MYATVGETISLKTARPWGRYWVGPPEAQAMLSSRENLGEEEKGCPSLGEAPGENTAQLKAAESPAQFLWSEAPGRDPRSGQTFKRQLVKGDHLGV